MADGGAGDAGTTDGGTTDGGAPDAGSLDAGTPGVVAPTFPGFAHFGQYLRRPSGPLHTASAIRCTGDEVGFHETCSNGGEHRSIYYPSVASCADHAVRDTRGFFDWTCEERDDAPGVVFHSRGLRPAVRLADLISAGAFVSNSVELLTGETVLATSAESVWWDTPIERLVGTAGMVSDLSVGPEGARIYWSDTDVDTGGFRIVDDGVSLVIAPGARALLRPGDAASCSFSSVATDQPDGHCAVFALGRNFVWVEGRFESGTSVPPNGLHGVVFGDVGYSRVRHVRIHDMDGFALSFERVHGLLLQDIDQSTADVGFELSGARFNRVYRLRLANNRGSNSISRLNAGAGESFHNVLVDIAATNSDRGLVFDCAGSHTIASRLLIANNDGYGLQSVCNTDMTFTHVTTLNNADRGFLLDRVSAQRATHILSANNANYGVRLFDAGAVEIAQMITVGNAGVGLNVEASELTLGGALITGDNTGPACELGAGGVGILDDTCTSDGAEGSTDYGAASGSDAVYRTARSAQASIYGPVAFDDRTNPVDVAGLADPGRTWWELSGPTRFFGRDGAFPANGSRGACRGTGCRVWIMSVDLDGFAFLSALDGTSNWAGAIGDVVCPAQTRGDIVMTDTIQLEILDDGVGDDDGRCDVAEACHPPNTFLINAFELIEDHIGDDDGLCESNEACRYSPHIGRYQDGDDTMDRWDVTCEFDDGGGPVQGVIMYGFVYTA